jgi:uncharacterized membrane protein YbhN (UPF0104 family)
MLAKIDAKQLIQIVWVLEVMGLLLVFIVCLFIFPGRMADFLAALPLLTALIGGQGVIAAAGPEIKRWTEAHFGRRQEGL